MANKEKEIIKKLLKIAENQQKIIKKLAQSQDAYSGSELPVKVKQLLDAGATYNLKNNLMLSFDGKNVNVKYNADSIKMNASQVKTLLQSALKGFVVMDPIGLKNPDPRDFKPNYVSEDPFYHKVDERDPNADIYKKYDPLYLPESMVNPPASVAPKAAPKAVSVSDEMKMTYSDSGLPAGVKQLLDAGAPGLKNNLMLSFDGKNVNVRYNADFVKIRASQVKTLLQSALKGFVVMDPIGVRNPDKSTWHPNY